MGGLEVGDGGLRKGNPPYEMTGLAAAVEKLPAAFPGPGGAVAVLRDGEVLERHCWGWAELAGRVPFAPQTPFRVCSITKQFTCATALARHPDLAELDADIQAPMPLLEGAPSATQLAHNQSGLRDYWATAMLCGSAVERTFDEADAWRLIGLTRSTQFVPGTRYSYCNQNFRILGDAVAERAGRPLDELMRRHVFEPAGMETAGLVPDTSVVPGGTVGYEGSVSAGFRAAVNRIVWTGDAGLVASLDDLIAWERFIDRTRDDANSVYGRISAEVGFADGTPALYGFGLNRQVIAGRLATGHGGGLRGWTSFRCYLPVERVSVVVLFNFMNDTRDAAARLIEALLGPGPKPSEEAFDPALADVYLDPETGLLARVEARPGGKLDLWYAGFRAETLDTSDHRGSTRLRRDGEALWLERPIDNLAVPLRRLEGEAGTLPEGSYRCDELGAVLTCVGFRGVTYAAFSGFLGTGEMQAVIPAGPGVWRYPCPRALDFAPPGDWTLRLLPEGGIGVGCWLARGLVFV